MNDEINKTLQRAINIESLRIVAPQDYYYLKGWIDSIWNYRNADKEDNKNLLEMNSKK